MDKSASLVNHPLQGQLRAMTAAPEHCASVYWLLARKRHSPSGIPTGVLLYILRHLLVHCRHLIHSLGRLAAMFGVSQTV